MCFQLGGSSVFAKLRKATVSSFASVCLSVRMKQLGAYLRDFHDILIVKFFRKSVKKIQFLLISDNNKAYCT